MFVTDLHPVVFSHKILLLIFLDSLDLKPTVLFTITITAYDFIYLDYFYCLVAAGMQAGRPDCSRLVYI
jgi:hypothetical protein